MARIQTKRISQMPNVSSLSGPEEVTLTQDGISKAASMDQVRAFTNDGPAGEPTGLDPATPTTLSFAYGATSTLTITPTGDTFDIWIDGIRHELTGAQDIDFTPADGLWFISYSADGFAASQDPWTIGGDVAPIAIVYVNIALVEALVGDERHGITMDWATHARLHHVDGAQISAGGAIGAWAATATAGNSNPALADVQVSIAQTTLRDEDIVLSLAALPAAGPYCLAYRTGNALQWAWTKTATVPYLAASYVPGAAYLEWNQYTGGQWVRTALADDQHVNYYVFATNFVSPAVARFLFVPGQAVHANLAAAQAESVLGLDLGGFPSAEFAPLWQLTFRAGDHVNFNDMPGRCGLAAAPVRLVGYKSSVASAVAPSSHTALTNRSTADAHPASAISVLDTLDNFVGTDLETILAEIAARLTALE
jgi:hypothetical protein